MLQPQKQDVILDIGCGGGTFTYEIAKKCKTSVGVELNLNKNLSQAMNKQPNLTYIKGDAQKLPIHAEKADKILLSSVLQMVEDDASLLNECHRTLKPQGTLILSVPTEYRHIKKLNTLKPQLKKTFRAQGKAYYNPTQLARLLRKAGFTITKTEYSPKKWGSMVTETGIYLWHQHQFPFFNPALFPLVYAIAYPDNFANKQQTGTELIIRAKKTADA